MSRKKPYNIIIHVGISNAPYSNSYEMFPEIQSPKNFILKFLPSVRTTISTLVLCLDKANTNDISKDFIELVEESN